MHNLRKSGNPTSENRKLLQKAEKTGNYNQNKHKRYHTKNNRNQDPNNPSLASVKDSNPRRGAPGSDDEGESDRLAGGGAWAGGGEAGPGGDAVVPTGALVKEGVLECRAGLLAVASLWSVVREVGTAFELGGGRIWTRV